MKSNILYIFTRTPLHVGAGNSVGAIDQPVMRERHTGFPIIPGSSIKGVFADYFLVRENGRVVQDESRKASKRDETAARIFGLGEGKKKNGQDETSNLQGQAGSLSLTEAKILAFPIRSAKGCFAWLTSPIAVARWARSQLSSQEAAEIIKELPQPTDAQAYFDKDELGEKAIFEDLVFENAGKFDFSTRLATVCSDPVWTAQAAKKLALVSDDLLGHFCRNTCDVAQHVVIDDETGVAKDGLLFNQENVPSETLFYSPIFGPSEDFKQLAEKIGDIAQFGGDASTGLGFCSLDFNDGKDYDNE